MTQAAQTAASLWRQYGEDAVVIATLRAAEVAALGDTEALAHWDEVAAILLGEADGGPAN
jgi:hypothetical protein